MVLLILGDLSGPPASQARRGDRRDGGLTTRAQVQSRMQRKLTYMQVDTRIGVDKRQGSKRPLRTSRAKFRLEGARSAHRAELQ